MFITYLLNTLKHTIRKEYQIYKLEKRLEKPSIVKPFSVVNPDRLEVGKNVIIQRNCHFHCGGMEWSKGKGSIKVGDNCWFSENNILYGAGEIEIGDMSGTGPNVLFFSSRDNYSLKYAKLPKIVHKYEKITIGSHVRIFSNVVISPGVNIGDGAVIGSCSIVTKDIPPWSIAMGHPARVTGIRDKDI